MVIGFLSLISKVSSWITEKQRLLWYDRRIYYGYSSCRVKFRFFLKKQDLLRTGCNFHYGCSEFRSAVITSAAVKITANFFFLRISNPLFSLTPYSLPHSNPNQKTPQIQTNTLIQHQSIPNTYFYRFFTIFFFRFWPFFTNPKNILLHPK